MGVFRQSTETILLRCSAAVELGLRCFPKAVVLSARPAIAAGLNQRGFPAAIAGRASVNDLGRHLEVGAAWRPLFFFSLAAARGSVGVNLMNLQLAYLGRSTIKPSPHGLAVSLAPNLRRDRVAFTGTLRQPLRFREAVS